MSVSQKPNRKQQILECLALMLESGPGQRITTAKLAAEVGVSEAALYRHFPSKARMFEGLIDFIEDSVFTRINIILTDHKEALVRCHHILHVLLYNLMLFYNYLYIQNLVHNYFSKRANY